MRKFRVTYRVQNEPESQQYDIISPTLKTAWAEFENIMECSDDAKDVETLYVIEKIEEIK